MELTRPAPYNPISMRQKILQLSRHRYARTTIKFGMVSVIATFIDLAVLNSGIKFLGLNPQISKTAAFLTATIATFPLQRRWVFRAEKSDGGISAKQWSQYLGASIAGFLASQGCITIAITIWPGNLLAINVANLIGFGTVWVFKLVFFQKVVFAVKEAEGITEIDDVIVPTTEVAPLSTSDSAEVSSAGKA